MPNMALRLTDGLKRFYNDSLRRQQQTQRSTSGRSRKKYRFGRPSLPVDLSMEFGSDLGGDLEDAGVGSEEMWLTDYLRGVSMELYSAQFSSAFEGMTFAEAGQFCMQRLELMLIAILAQSSVDGDNGETDLDEEGTYSYLAINPSVFSKIAINEGTVGFFICDSQVSTRSIS